ncbi:hypothetical protein, variant [Spizellomyces punctatus DAOM BR117]|nr:hypothetical protein, variant [Spizellomyces punctatus DAOM BR117]KND04947.1 hypothetical protein, variant [Spizellomyces punctatus DAOM BR117]|eukprot:XP_016612986.1 hypothetical protein, variant [Spizellomyces punctatus DAOM BR117]
MVPFGPFAFMPGQLIHTNEVLVLLGDNWFAERSVKEALEIVGRRREYTTEQVKNLKLAQKELYARMELTELEDPRSSLTLEKSNVDSDGDEVNEEGLKFVEIREEYNEEAEKARQKRPVQPLSEPKPTADESVQSFSDSNITADAKHFDEFERRLFEKIKQYEEEEEAGYLDNDIEEEEEEHFDSDSDGEMRFETMDDDEDDFNQSLETFTRIRSSLKKPAKAQRQGEKVPKHVSFDENIQTTAPASIRSPSDIYEQMRAKSKDMPDSTGSPRAIAEPHRPPQAHSVKDLIIEKEDVEQMSEDETDDFLFGRELLNEYHLKRNQLIQAQSVHPLTAEEEDVASEERLQNKVAKVSRFKAARMAVREAVELPQILQQLAEPSSEPASVAVQEPQKRIKPCVPVRALYNTSGGSHTIAGQLQSPKRDVIKNVEKKAVDAQPSQQKVSRFKAARMSSAASSSTQSSGPEASVGMEEEGEESDEGVIMVPRVSRRLVAPPVVGRASSSDKRIPIIQNSKAAEDSETASVRSDAQSQSTGKKVSRFKAMRMGINEG